MQKPRPEPWRAADGSAAGRLLVARSRAHGEASSPNSARLDPDSDDAWRFVELEEWANEGEALPYPAAKELIEELFGEDRPGSGRWQVAGRPMTDELAVPTLHLTAARDLIAPAATAPAGTVVGIAIGPCRDDRRLGASAASRRRSNDILDALPLRAPSLSGAPRTRSSAG